jgi:hypothetical protein
MDQSNRAPRQTHQLGSVRACQFSLKDLVRVDFVFPYGRVAATGFNLRPEPFDRDAEFVTDPQEMELLKQSARELFKKQGRTSVTARD